jgi:hypothetical protein
MALFLWQGPQNAQDISTYESTASKYDFEMSMAWCVVGPGPENFCKKILEEIEYRPQERSVVYVLEDMGRRRVKHRTFVGQSLDGRKLAMFFEGWLSHELPHVLRSEVDPKWHENDYIHRLSAYSYKKRVFNGRYDSIVIYTTAQCRACAQYLEIYEKAAKKLFLNKGIEFFRIDLSKNEVAGRDEKYLNEPVVRLFPHRDRKFVVKMEGCRTVGDVIEKVRIHSGFEWVEPQTIRSDL